MSAQCDAHHDGHDCSQVGACAKALLAMLERVDNRPRLERERMTAELEADLPAELLAELANVRSQSVRRNLIAYHTAEELACPHCHVGPGQACLTFPRARHATFTHMKRVRARLAQVESQLARISVPEA